VISAGRRAAPVALWLGRRGARTVHCMRPGAGAARFDLLVVGRHDSPAPAANVMPILGATHRVSPARLAAARAEWAELGTLPGPRVALLVGGPVRGEGLDMATAAALVPAARRHFPDATILATTSRRTGAAATARIAADLAGSPHRLFRWGDAGPNPYAGFLAWADAVIVTADSVSMLSEACATGRPVLIAGEAPGRHAALAESLCAAGYASRLPAPGLPHPAAPLDESARVAARLRELGFA
ncbi:mitochondrial fission ELM1 family protein, partial [Teichococcus wenyumeiae]